MNATAPQYAIEPSHKPTYTIIEGNEGIERYVQRSSWRDAPRTIRQGLRLLQLQKGDLDEHNDKVIAGLEEEDKVLVYGHGIGLSGNIFAPVIPLARAREYKLIAPTYRDETDSKVALNSHFKPVLEQVAEKGAHVHGLIGHSTAADHFRDGLLYDPELKAYVTENQTKVVLSAANTNGAKPLNFWQRFLKSVGEWHDMDDITTSEGLQRNVALRKPLRKELKDLVTTVTCTRDQLMPPHQGSDPFGTNVIVEGYGHVLGCMAPEMHELYIDIVEGLIEQQL